MDRGGSEASGRASPLGARRADGGTNFSVWSRTAAQVDLLLFDDVDDARPSRVIALEPLRNRTSNFWHVLVPNVEPGQVYVWRVHGTFDPAAGLRHDASALLLDPYGVAVAVPANYDRMAGTRPGRDPRTAMKSVVGGDAEQKILVVAQDGDPYAHLQRKRHCPQHPQHLAAEHIPHGPHPRRTNGR